MKNKSYSWFSQVSSFLIIKFLIVPFVCFLSLFVQDCMCMANTLNSDNIEVARNYYAYAHSK